MIRIWINYLIVQQSDHAVLITAYPHNNRVSFFLLIMQSMRVGGKLATNSYIEGDVTVQWCGHLHVWAELKTRFLLTMMICQPIAMMFQPAQGLDFFSQI